MELQNVSRKNIILASGILHLPLPKAHRVFTANIPDFPGVDLATAYFVAMDYIAEPTLEACWGSLDKASRESMT